MKTTFEQLHIGIVSQWYKPENAPIPSDIAQHLVAAGHTVTVLTGFPNYPSGVIFPGYKQRWRQTTSADGIRVVRSPVYPSHDANAVKRVVNYLSFAATTTLNARALRSCDVVYVYSSPITATAAALACKVLWKIPFVAHVQDLWPESVLQSGMITTGSKGVAARLLFRICNAIYRRASTLVTIAPRMKRMLVERGIPEHQIASIYNWSTAAPSTAHPGGARASTDTPRSVIYAGNLGVAQDLTSVVDALEACGPDLDLDVRMIGAGVVAGELHERSRRVRQLSVHEPVERSAMEGLYAAADFSLVTLRDVPLFRGTIPSKFQASLAYGLPVITSVRGDVSEIVTRYGCGIVVDPTIKGSMEAALREAASMSDEDLAAMRAACRRATDELFDRSLCLNKLTDLLVSTVTSPTRNGR